METPNLSYAIRSDPGEILDDSMLRHTFKNHNLVRVEFMSFGVQDLLVIKHRLAQEYA